MTKLKKIIKDTNGDAVVEATILFPIMIMIFFALMILAMYLPQRTILQEAAQFTATAIAAEVSDTYIEFDDKGNCMMLDSEGNRTRKELNNVYWAALKGILGSNLKLEEKADSIARHYAARGILTTPGEISVEYKTVNYVIYQELTVKITQTIPVPVNFSFIGFPVEIVLVQEAKTVIQNGDEFVRNVDIAKDMVIWLDKKLGISKNLSESGAFDKIDDMLEYFGF